MPSNFHKPLAGDERAMLAAADSDAEVEPVPNNRSQSIPSSSTTSAQHFGCAPQHATQSQKGKYKRVN
eukprot:2059929-Pleurochrysis_carterae.AAC.1